LGKKFPINKNLKKFKGGFMRGHLTVLFLVFFLGCSTTVNLTVHNPEKFQQEIRLALKDSIRTPLNEIHLGTVDPNQERKEIFKVEHGGEFTIISRIPRSADVFSTTRTVTKNDPDPYNLTVNLTKQGEFLDESYALDAINSSFRRLGPNVGAYPVDLNNALETLLGALVVVTPGENGQEGIVHHRLTPGQFSRPVSLEQFRYPSNSDKKTVKLTGKTAAKISSSFPLWGGFGIESDSDTVYEFDWEMNGFGMVQKPEDPNWNYIMGFNNLDHSLKYQLTSTVEKNPGAVIMYINQIYVLKRAELKIKTGTKLTAGSQVDAGSVITFNGVYTFQNSTTENKLFESSVINFGGSRIVTAIKVNTPSSYTPPFNEPSSVIYPTWLSGVRTDYQKNIPDDKNFSTGILWDTKGTIWLDNVKNVPNLEYELLVIEPTASENFLTRDLQGQLLKQ
jgi:hypothetical protein